MANIEQLFWRIHVLCNAYLYTITFFIYRMREIRELTQERKDYSG